MKQETRKEYTRTMIVLLVLLFAFAIRLLYLYCYPVQPRDSFLYLNFIEDFNKLKTLDTETIIPPLSIYLMGLFRKFFNIPAIKSAIIVNMIAGVSIVLFIFKIVQNIFKNFTCGIISGIIASTHSRLIEYSCKALRENIYLLFLVIFFYELIQRDKKEPKTSIFCGIATCLCFLCRFEGFELFIIFPFYLGYKLIIRELNIRKAIQYEAIFVISACLTLYLTNQIMGLSLSYYSFINTYIERKIILRI